MASDDSHHDPPDHAEPRRGRGTPPRPAPDADPRGLPAAVRGGRVRRDPRPARLPRLRERRRRGLDGRRDRGLVRGHRAVQAPARAPGPAHRADPEAQGRARQGARGVRRRELPPRGDHPRAGRLGHHLAARRPLARRTRARPAGRRRDRRRRRARAQPGPRRAHRGADPGRAGAALPRGADLAAAGQPARGGRARRPAPRAGRPRPGRAAPLAGGEPGHRRRDPRRAGAVVGADAAQRRGDLAGAPRAGAVGRGHPRRPAPPRPAGAGLDARPARRRPAQRPVHPGAHRAVQGAAARPPAGARVERLAVERAAPLAPGLADRPGRRRTPAAAGRDLVVRRAAARRRAAASAPRRARRGRRGLRRGPVRRGGHRRSSPTRSSAGTARRPPDGSSCTSAATCSSSGSTAPSSAAWSVW